VTRHQRNRMQGRSNATQEQTGGLCRGSARKRLALLEAVCQGASEDFVPPAAQRKAVGQTRKGASQNSARRYFCPSGSVPILLLVGGDSTPAVDSAASKSGKAAVRVSKREPEDASKVSRRTALRADVPAVSRFRPVVTTRIEAPRKPRGSQQVTPAVECISGEAMTRVESLEEEIQKLSPSEFAQLREWLLERDWQMWDAQIERDAADGKLDALFAEAEQAHRAGKSTKF